MKAVQSAMAIRRQRRRRDEAVRAKARRSSHQSDNFILSDSGLGSQMSLDGHKHRSVRHRQVVGGITTLHVGIVFLFIGIMLLISGLVPGYSNRQNPSWDERYSNTAPSNNKKPENSDTSPLMMATGALLILAGIVLIIANRIAAHKEEEHFSRYISHKLAAAAKGSHQAMPSHNHAQHTHRKSSIISDEQMQYGIDADPIDNGDDSAAQCTSPNSQLESIVEEAEGYERASNKKDHFHWTSDVAPVHRHSHEKSHAARESKHQGDVYHHKDTSPELEEKYRTID